MFLGSGTSVDTQLDFRVFPKPLPASAKLYKPNPFGWTPTRRDTKTHPHKSGDQPRNHKKLSSAPHRVAFHHPERPRREQQCKRAARSGGLPVGPFSGGPLTPTALNALEEVRVCLFVSVTPLVCCLQTRRQGLRTDT